MLRYAGNMSVVSVALHAVQLEEMMPVDVERGAVVFLSDCVTLESSDLSPLLYLHSEQSKTERKAHSRHFHV